MYRLVVDFDGSEAAAERLRSFLARNVGRVEAAFGVSVSRWEVHPRIPATGDDDDD